jgi:predicted aspartyl protease
MVTMAGRRAIRVLVALLASACLIATASGDEPPRERLAQGPGPPARATAILEAPTVVPIEVVGNLTLVHATVNAGLQAMLIVDASASTTLLTPLLMKRLGQPIPRGARRREVSAPDGQRLDVPLVTIAVVQVGSAQVWGLEAGVLDAFPEAPEIEGVLGADFLQRFRLTLDKDGRRMTLAPLPR